MAVDPTRLLQRIKDLSEESAKLADRIKQDTAERGASIKQAEDAIRTEFTVELTQLRAEVGSKARELAKAKADIAALEQRLEAEKVAFAVATDVELHQRMTKRARKLQGLINDHLSDLESITQEKT